MAAQLIILIILILKKQNCINYMDQRIFYGLLERVGGNGRYQTISLCIWSILMGVLGSTSFSVPFLFNQSKYECPQGYSNCKEYVCALPLNERAQFIHDDLFSLATKFGDYRCDSNVELDFLQSFIYLGGVLGVIVGAFFFEVMTKRIMLIITTLLITIGLIITVFGQTILISSIGVFVTFAAGAIQFEIIQCFIVETVSENIRGQHMTINDLFYSVGVAANGLFFYLLKNFQWYIFILIPIYVTLFFILIFYIEETPFDLIVNFSAEESLAALNRIAVANSRQGEHKITLAELENIKREFEENEEQKQHEDISILDLFRYDSLRKLTIVSLVLHYVISFQFAAPQIAVRSYSLSIYTNSAIIGSAELLASLLCYFIVDDFQRKKVIYISQAVCIAISIPVFLFFSCLDESCSLQMEVMQTIGLTIFRFAATIAYTFFYMMQYEAFPNQIRGLALQVVCLPSFFAAVNIPQIITFCENTGISIVFTFIICSIIIVAMMTCLPQTFGIPPPQMIEELKYEHKDLDDPKFQQKIKKT